MWIETWGEHMHHGYYEDGRVGGQGGHQQAQIDMIDNAVSWAYLGEVRGSDVYRSQSIHSVIDVGCGVGGSSRHIAKMTGCTGAGVSLSPRQVADMRCLLLI